jgi:hypothetical protein
LKKDFPLVFEPTLPRPLTPATGALSTEVKTLPHSTITLPHKKTTPLPSSVTIFFGSILPTAPVLTVSYRDNLFSLLELLKLALRSKALDIAILA